MPSRNTEHWALVLTLCAWQGRPRLGDGQVRAVRGGVRGQGGDERVHPVPRALGDSSREPGRVALRVLLHPRCVPNVPQPQRGPLLSEEYDRGGQRHLSGGRGLVADLQAVPRGGGVRGGGHAPPPQAGDVGRPVMLAVRGGGRVPHVGQVYAVHPPRGVRGGGLLRVRGGEDGEDVHRDRGGVLQHRRHLLLQVQRHGGGRGDHVCYPRHHPGVAGHEYDRI
mmetsp:Transcript_40654/g.98895  ORF Transcript_40654/g.98895 Transcript_40654/m.98895 type:complete len:223 (+) Transcript_40654:1432-2100(+)